MSVIEEKIRRRKELGMTADQFNAHLKSQVLDTQLRVNRSAQECIKSVMQNFDDETVDAVHECHKRLEEERDQAVAEAQKFGVLPKSTK